MTGLTIFNVVFLSIFRLESLFKSQWRSSKKQQQHEQWLEGGMIQSYKGERKIKS